MISAMPQAWRLQLLEETASTQDVALAAAAAGDPGRLAVRALRQTAGRGRAGRAWLAPAGNLNLSLLLRPDPGAAVQPGRYALLAGLAVYQAILACAPGLSGLMLKWPNDVMRDGAKLGGILIDSQMAAYGGLGHVVIGIGVNLRQAPAVDGRQTADLADTAIEAQALMAAILPAIDRGLAAPMAQICSDWQACAHPPGTMLTLRVGDALRQARFAGLGPDGTLLLEGDPAGIASAEILTAHTRGGEGACNS